MINVNKGISTSDRVYAILLERIQFCEMMPGFIIDEKELIQEFGVSRTPIREAITRLNRQHLIDIYPQSKTLVSRIDLQQIADIVFMRRNLDVLVYKTLCARCDPLTPVVDKYLKLEELSIRSGEWRDAVQNDYKFHGALYDLAGHSFAWNLIERELMPCYTRLRFFNEMAHIDYIEQPRTHDEHVLIAQSIRKGDMKTIISKDKMERHDTGFIHPTLVPYIQEHPEYFSNIERFIP